MNYINAVCVVTASTMEKKSKRMANIDLRGNAYYRYYIVRTATDFEHVCNFYEATGYSGHFIIAVANRPVQRYTESRVHSEPSVTDKSKLF